MSIFEAAKTVQDAPAFEKKFEEKGRSSGWIVTGGDVEMVEQEAEVLENEAFSSAGSEEKLERLIQAINKGNKAQVQAIKEMHKEVKEGLEGVYDRCDKVGNKVEMLEWRMMEVHLDRKEWKRQLKMAQDAYEERLEELAKTEGELKEGFSLFEDQMKGLEREVQILIQVERMNRLVQVAMAEANAQAQVNHFTGKRLEAANFRNEAKEFKDEAAAEFVAGSKRWRVLQDKVDDLLKVQGEQEEQIFEQLKGFIVAWRASFEADNLKEGEWAVTRSWEVLMKVILEVRAVKGKKGSTSEAS